MYMGIQCLSDESLFSSKSEANIRKRSALAPILSYSRLKIATRTRDHSTSHPLPSRFVSVLSHILVLPLDNVAVHQVKAVQNRAADFGIELHSLPTCSRWFDSVEGGFVVAQRYVRAH